MSFKPVQQSAVLEPVHPEVERYLHRMIEERTSDPVLLKMERLAKERNFPIVGRLVGHFLRQMAEMIGARRIFEFGSGFGYSAYWFAKAVGEGGEVICTDADPENRRLAERFLEEAGLKARIRFQVGLAQEVFKLTEGTFDVCYNDVDKGDYPEVWKLARERIRVGGLYIADNTLWYGRVVKEGPVEDIVPGWTEAIRAHNEMIFRDPDFEAFIHPVRDGVLVARRIR